MKDFTFDVFILLIKKLKSAGYLFQTVRDYINQPEKKVVLLRHDIDIWAGFTRTFAKIEHDLGVRGTYYYRTIKYCYDPAVMKQVAALGHEIGYHYEDLTSADGNIELALKTFEGNVQKFRLVYPVETVCMHGRSGSPFDNRDIWKHAKLGDYGLIAEPYISLDFDRMLYLTDTSQSWNGSGVAVRDKVTSSFEMEFDTTWDILQGIDKLPDQIMFTFHPELWALSYRGWLLRKVVFTGYYAYKKHYRNLHVSPKKVPAKRSKG
ncbi:MAG: hypothetical protein FJ042_01225 [Candidatus Cloacimonetes bacterium]|nr:hypothetical protein [Candidatus Cloacimonadota bacterium]